MHRQSKIQQSASQKVQNMQRTVRKSWGRLVHNAWQTALKSIIQSPVSFLQHTRCVQKWFIIRHEATATPRLFHLFFMRFSSGEYVFIPTFHSTNNSHNDCFINE